MLADARHLLCWINAFDFGFDLEAAGLSNASDFGFHH
jgi:hypothetical protein